jgi:hypothetical protein
MKYSLEQEQFIHRQFVAKKMYLSHATVPVAIKKHMLDLERNYPDHDPLTNIQQIELRDEVIKILTYPDVSHEIIQYCIFYLKRKNIW